MEKICFDLIRDKNILHSDKNTKIHFVFKIFQLQISNVNGKLSKIFQTEIRVKLPIKQPQKLTNTTFLFLLHIHTTKTHYECHQNHLHTLDH